ncbi:MAG: S8 family serine peptidase [Chlorobi bacterium]|nr:S8 family serine peptidase [Chlorobiota bacterium]
MKKSKFVILFFLLLIPGITVNAQVAPNKYILELTDKLNNDYTIGNPERFLSQRAIERRTKQNIEIEENDLPISNYYIDSLKKLNLRILNRSKWFNSLLIFSTDTLLLDTIENISFVNKLYLNTGISTNKSKHNKFLNHFEKTTSAYNYINTNYDYGFGYNQIHMVNGHLLHELGYRGEGMQIAIIDAGFANADSLNVFDSIWANNQVLGTHDFVDGGEIQFDKHYHGSAVFSIIGANDPGMLIGTAPKAKFWLLRSEDVNSEYRVEEENWIAAAEFADSVGADVINTSLGYSVFDDPAQNYTYSEMDGNTARISIASKIAATKGMILVNSAGNSGNDDWHYITAPADADSIITVGAVDSLGRYIYFSSVGPTADGRIKPNITAQGYKTAIQINTNQILLGSGTSFSSPLIAGMVACLWQAKPNLSNMEIIQSIEKSANNYNTPDELVGYGIPDFSKALNIANSIKYNFSKSTLASVNPTLFFDHIYIDFFSDTNQQVTLQIIDASGRTVKLQTENANAHELAGFTINGLEKLSRGFYIFTLTANNTAFQQKLIKP